MHSGADDEQTGFEGAEGEEELLMQEAGMQPWVEPAAERGPVERMQVDRQHTHVERHTHVGSTHIDRHTHVERHAQAAGAGPSSIDHMQEDGQGVQRHAANGFHAAADRGMMGDAAAPTSAGGYATAPLPGSAGGE